MNLIINFFLLVISCYLCSSAVLFTPDEVDHRNLVELTRTGELYQHWMDLYTVAEKQFICQEIIESPQFVDLYNLDFVEKSQDDILLHFNTLYPALFSDHYFTDSNGAYEFYPVTDKLLKFNARVPFSVPLKSFGCLARNWDVDMNHLYPLVEVFVSYTDEDYTFAVSIRDEQDDTLQSSDDIRYIGLAEFYVSKHETTLSSPLCIINTGLGSSFRWPIILTEIPPHDYYDLRVEASPPSLQMEKHRRDRLCKIAFDSLYYPDVDVNTVEAEDVRNGELPLNDDDMMMIPVFYCSCTNSSDFNGHGKLYMTPSKVHSDAVYILESRGDESNLFDLTGEFIPTMPPLNTVYLQTSNH